MSLRLVASWDDSQNDVLLENAGNRYMDLLTKTFHALLAEKNIEAVELRSTLNTQSDEPTLEIIAVHPECDALTGSKIFAALNHARNYASIYMDQERITPDLTWRDVTIVSELVGLTQPSERKFLPNRHLRLV